MKSVSGKRKESICLLLHDENFSIEKQNQRLAGGSAKKWETHN